MCMVYVGVGVRCVCEGECFLCSTYQGLHSFPADHVIISEVALSVKRPRNSW